MKSVKESLGVSRKYGVKFMLSSKDSNVTHTCDANSSIEFNPLNTKSRLLYLKTRFVPRTKHFPPRL